MIISSILKRESLHVGSKINILWTPVDNDFEKFVINLDHNLLSFNQVYYGDSVPNLIICNNKIDYYKQCYNISKKLHLPVLLIDHIIKNPLFDNNKIKNLDSFPCYHHVCVSKKISDSWELKNVQILSYNINDKDNINIWKNLIFQISKKIFTM